MHSGLRLHVVHLLILSVTFPSLFKPNKTNTTCNYGPGNATLLSNILNVDNIKGPSGHFNTSYLNNIDTHINIFNCGTVAHELACFKNFCLFTIYLSIYLWWFPGRELNPSHSVERPEA